MPIKKLIWETGIEKSSIFQEKLFNKIFRFQSARK